MIVLCVIVLTALCEWLVTDLIGEKSCLLKWRLSVIPSSLFSVDLWEEKFIDCKMENTTFKHSKHGCHLDTVEENDFLIYLVSFLGSLAVLPGNIISALFMEKIGRVKIIGDWNWMFTTENSFFLNVLLLYYAARDKDIQSMSKRTDKKKMEDNEYCSLLFLVYYYYFQPETIKSLYRIHYKVSVFVHRWLHAHFSRLYPLPVSELQPISNHCLAMFVLWCKCSCMEWHPGGDCGAVPCF